MTTNTRDQLWASCTTCCGQGRIHHQHDGAWLWQPCPTCIGVGADITITDTGIESEDTK